MANKKEKICKAPKCKKEVHAPKALFCGEHERDYRDYRDKGIKYGTYATGALAGVAYVTKFLSSLREKNN